MCLMMLAIEFQRLCLLFNRLVYDPLSYVLAESRSLWISTSPYIRSSILLYISPDERGGRVFVTEILDSSVTNISRER
jgi:hypothetical protein